MKTPARMILATTILAFGFVLLACGEEPPAPDRAEGKGPAPAATPQAAAPTSAAPAAPVSAAPAAPVSAAPAAPVSAAPAAPAMAQDLVNKLLSCHYLTVSARVPARVQREEKGKVVYDDKVAYKVAYVYIPNEKQGSMTWTGRTFAQKWKYVTKQGRDHVELSFTGRLSDDSTRLEACAFDYHLKNFDTSKPGADLFTEDRFSLRVKQIPFSVSRKEGKIIMFEVKGEEAGRAFTAANRRFEKFLRGQEKAGFEKLLPFAELPEKRRASVSCLVTFYGEKPRGW